MANQLDSRVQAQRFAKVLDEMDRRIKALERAAQAGHTSIEAGALDIYDEDGLLRGSVGVQPDGTVAVVPVNSAPPPTPTSPVLEPVLSGLLVAWDGGWADAYDTPLDFARVQAHVGPTADFVPDDSTLAATISNRAGGMTTIALPAYDPVWVRLVGVNTAEITGPAGAAVQGTPRQVDGPDLSALLDLADWLKDESIPGSKLVRETIGADRLAANSVTAGKIDVNAVTAREIKALSIEANHVKAGVLEGTHLKAGTIQADKLAIGTVRNFLPDPSFEGEAGSALVAGNAYWSIDAALGNGSAKSLKANGAAATATDRNLTLVSVPMLAGEQLYLQADYQASTDYNGTSVRLMVQWQNTVGSILGFGIADSGTPVRGATWQKITATPTAPAGTTRAVIIASCLAGTAGAVWFDNVDRKSTRLNSSHRSLSRMPSSA